jgi:hypothetical protein
MEINFKDHTMTIPGCGQWTEEKWERLAEAIGATLGPRPEDWEDVAEDSDGPS